MLAQLSNDDRGDGWRNSQIENYLPFILWCWNAYFEESIVQSCVTFVAGEIRRDVGEVLAKFIPKTLIE